jgi:hypothetical protein
MVWMWDTQKGEPTNVKGSTQSCLGPFKVGMESVNHSYYLSTLEGRRHPLPISRAPPQTPPRWGDLISQVSVGK